MRPGGPIITVNDYDKDDDTDCGCETCTSPWGAQVLPLLDAMEQLDRQARNNVSSWLEEGVANPVT